tara:strand:+ start:885 stop:2378 length:1494 start_codon:yes stop_codon:yes gene_type:complete
MIRRIRNLFTRSGRKSARRPDPAWNPATYWKSRYFEAAKETRHNAKYWSNAGNQDPDSTVERDLVKLRNRARHVTRNSSYAKGMMETLAQDVVGVGPTLNVDTETSADMEIETDFRTWSRSCDIQGRQDLASLLQGAVRGLVETGEALFVLGRGDSAGGSTLKIQAVEPDRLASPWELYNDPSVDMGVEKDSSGRVVAYWINDKHPGDTTSIVGGLTHDNFTRVPADQVVHLYRLDRPGQSRGIPWIAPALDLFAHQHRFTHATVLAAETAAAMSAVLESDIGLGSPSDPDDLDNYEIEYDTLVTLPAGYKVSQLKAEHPATTFEMFTKMVLSEMARCLNMPLNVAAANSSNHNFASGRLDHQIYYKFCGVVRQLIETVALRPIFINWFTERQLGSPGRRILRPIDPVWYWPGPAVAIDPVKEAQANLISIQSGILSKSEICARDGRSYESTARKIAKDNELDEELGITPEPAEPPEGLDDDTEENDDSPENATTAA